MRLSESVAPWPDTDAARTDATTEAAIRAQRREDGDAPDRPTARMTLADSLAVRPDVDLARIDATTEAEIQAQMRADGYDPDADIGEADIVSPAIIRRRLGMSQRVFAAAIHVPVATLQNWEQGRTPMDPSARSLMTILAREPEVALRALAGGRVG
jgi:putative transcriptional regulator